MSNSNQEIIESRLATYIDGELDDSERLEIEQHLQQNPQYRRVIDDLRKQRDMLRGLPREAAPLEMSEAFTNQLERSELLDGNDEDVLPPMRLHRRMPRMLAAAAIVLLTTGIGLTVYYVLPDRNGHPVAIVQHPGVSPSATAPSSAVDINAEGVKPAGTIDDATAKSKKIAEAEAMTRDVEARKMALPPSAVASKPLALNEEKRVSPDAIAMNIPTDNKSAGGAFRSTVRDLELDALAKNVSRDPQVRRMLSEKPGAAASVPGKPAGVQNAVVLVVRANDPRRIQSELAQFFTRDNIDWHAAPRQVELPLNTTLARDENAIAEGFSDNRQPIDPTAIESDAKRAAPNGADTPVANATAAARSGGVQFESNTARRDMTKLAAKDEASEKKESIQDKMGRGGRALQTNALAEDHDLGARLSKPDDSSGAALDRRGAWSANQTPVDNLYVARRLSRRQADALNAYLNQADGAQKEADGRRVGAYDYAENSVALAANIPAHPGNGIASAQAQAQAAVPAAAPTANPSQPVASAPTAPAPAAPAPATSAPGSIGGPGGETAKGATSQGFNRAEMPVGGGLGGGQVRMKDTHDAAVPHPAQTDGSARASAGPATQPSLIVKRASVADSDERLYAEPATREANQPATPPGRGIRLSDAIPQDRRASFGAVGHEPATQPAGLADADGPVDVIIVVQRQSPADTIAAPAIFPPAAASIAVPTTTPTTVTPTLPRRRVPIPTSQPEFLSK